MMYKLPQLMPKYRYLLQVHADIYVICVFKILISLFDVNIEVSAFKNQISTFKIETSICQIEIYLFMPNTEFFLITDYIFKTVNSFII